jgi:hypothetical protein
MPVAAELLRPYIVSSAGDVFRFDSSESEQHERSWTWTREPLESGAEISDHRIDNQVPLRMTVVVSSAEQGGVRRDRDVEEWRRLRGLAAAAPPLLFEVYTRADYYEDMVFTRVGWARTPDQGRTLVADIELVRMDFARTDIAQNLADAAVDIAQGEVDLGSQGLGNTDSNSLDLSNTATLQDLGIDPGRL